MSIGRFWNPLFPNFMGWRGKTGICIISKKLHLNVSMFNRSLRKLMASMWGNEFNHFLFSKFQVTNISIDQKFCLQGNCTNHVIGKLIYVRKQLKIIM